MDPNKYENSKRMFFVNSLIRQLQNAIITNPELRFVFLIAVGVLILFVVGKLLLNF